MLTTIGGRLEGNESVEEGLDREVMEEAGLVLSDERFAHCLLVLGEYGYVQTLLLELLPHLREMRKQESWPGTQLSGHDAQVYYFDCNEETKALILGKAERLYEWTQPERLEDLCFFRNQEPWLVTIAHERQGFINATEDYDMKRIEAIEGIVIGK